MLYGKDCSRAIALLQTTEQLRHQTYNVGSGRATSNRELVTAIKTVVPSAKLQLEPGRNPAGPGHDVYLDTARLRKDTGFEPQYDLETAAADYIAWLRSGNDR
jgi:UDP-glucose 4-epimerase